MMRPARSLKSRALQLLAQREQSRVELRRKLLVHAAADDELRLEAARKSGASGSRKCCGPNSTSAGASCGGSNGLSGTAGGVDESVGAERQVEAVLDWLEANGLSSDERFAESRVNARAARHGERRIRQELNQHHITIPAQAAQMLRETEELRALAVWQRKFGAPAQTAAATAKQARFLLARGFSPEAVWRVVGLPRAAKNAFVDTGDDSKAKGKGSDDCSAGC